jgi:hypothetical protein
VPAIGRHLHGSAALSSASSAGLPGSRDAALRMEAELPTCVVIVYTWKVSTAAPPVTSPACSAMAGRSRPGDPRPTRRTCGITHLEKTARSLFYLGKISACLIRFE